MKKTAIFCASFTFFVLMLFTFFSSEYKEASVNLFAETKMTITDVSDGVFSFVSQKNLLRENEYLKEQLSKKYAPDEHIKRENEELKAALNLAEKSRDKTLAARVVAINTHSGFFITLNRGATHGVKTGDVVVFGNALAGVVSEVFPSYSIFLPITAEGRTTGVMDENASPGFVTGSLSQATENLCSLSFFAESDAAVGDKIITSGLSDLYPAGLLVGEICQTGKNITVKTEIDFFKTRIFSVILSQ